MSRDSDFQSLATLYDKPLDYVKATCRVHGVDPAKLPAFRFAGDGLGPFYSDLSAFFDISPSMTKQEFAADCDINNIMKRFVASNFDPSVLNLSTRQAQYGDFTSMPDSYHAALNFIKDSDATFMKVDAGIRSRFDNDPQKFFDFVTDPRNSAELIDMGLASPSPLGSPEDATSSAGLPKGKVSKKPSTSASNAVSEGDQGE